MEGGEVQFDLASVAVYGRFRERTASKFVASGGIAVTIVFFFFNTVAGFAYATFGADTKPNFMVPFHFLEAS